MLKNLEKKRKWLFEQPEVENDENLIPNLVIVKKTKDTEQKSPPSGKDKVSRVLKNLTFLGNGTKTPVDDSKTEKPKKSRSFSDTALKNYAKFKEDSPSRNVSLRKSALYTIDETRDERFNEEDPFAVTPSQPRLALQKLHGLLDEKQERIEQLECFIKKLESDLASRDKVIGMLTVDLQETQQGYMELEQEFASTRDHFSKIVASKDQELRDCYECIDALDRDGLAAGDEEQPETPFEQIIDEAEIPFPHTPSRKSHDTSEANDFTAADENDNNNFIEPATACNMDDNQTLVFDSESDLLVEKVRRFKAECHLEMEKQKVKLLEDKIDEGKSPFC